MKIAQVVCTFPPYKGGMGNTAYHYSLELAKLGHAVTVFTPHFKDRLVNFQNFTIRGVAPWLSYGLGAWSPRLAWELSDFDIIQLHYPFFGGALPLWWLKKIKPRKTKLVLLYQMDVLGQGIWRRVFNWHAKYLMPGIIRAADKIIITSRDYAASSRLAPWLSIFPDKFVEIPLGVDTAVFQPTPPDSELIKKYQLKPGEKVILFTAALDTAHYFKGLDILLAATATLKNPARLVVVGKGDLKDFYERRAEELGLKDRVTFAGYLSDRDLARH
ncbi:MAG: glycosyltransferase, partial [Patescibacteria group bacterium]